MLPLEPFAVHRPSHGHRTRRRNTCPTLDDGDTRWVETVHRAEREKVLGQAHSAVDREAIIWIGCDGREVAEVLRVLSHDWRFLIRYCRSRLYDFACLLCIDRFGSSVIEKPFQDLERARRPPAGISFVR